MKKGEQAAEISLVVDLYKKHKSIELIRKAFDGGGKSIHIQGVAGSGKAIVASMFHDSQKSIIILPDKEEAQYLYNDINLLLNKPQNLLFFPSSFRRNAANGEQDTSNIILRTEAIQVLTTAPNFTIVTYPEALLEKVPSFKKIEESTLHVKVEERIDIEFVVEMLHAYKFERVDFVYEPGQYAVRGSIVDIYSFSNENPYRIDFFDDVVESIRTFDLETQLSISREKGVTIIPNLAGNNVDNQKVDLIDLFPENLRLWVQNLHLIESQMEHIYDEVALKQEEINEDEEHAVSVNELSAPTAFTQTLSNYTLLEMGSSSGMKTSLTIEFHQHPQPRFHKNFDLLETDILQRTSDGFERYILADNQKQFERLLSIYREKRSEITFKPILHTLHEGLIDDDLALCLYTDHQIFERYHKYSLRTDKPRAAQNAISLKELTRMNPGDYVVHIDHGVGRFGGLVTTNENGKHQESIRLVFRDNDVLFVNILSLHKISKFKGKDGEPPKINKLGSATWQNLKEKTKSKVKDIARELIALYAKRKSEPGFAFSADSYMQTELEASFLYEDTPDQDKSTRAVKLDMESSTPMDRLICGDVGFGKTEIAVRAAFKAVADNKQVAILVPTTILALQHFRTFSDRLKDFPCTIEHLSRLRSAKETKEIKEDLKKGKINILIGTHRIISKDVAFHDLGLLIIDEEQHFGVAVKERLKEIKVNVDTLTLTATPIPRTLQFSLLGARDLSVLNTPPTNRHPVVTEVHTFNDKVIKDAISQEVNRGGQVFFLNNRINNLTELAVRIETLLPHVKTGIAHGQLPAAELEDRILSFINGDYDVLVCTTIIESGLDISNANTIIINNANNFGLSELHQLRGRVGRSNKKAYCYLLAPPPSVLPQDAKRRLRIIEEFSELGSGFQIAMQDLDIRGAGNLLGGEQSGFISDIGYETYQKILNEAVQELRDTEFKELYQKDPQAVQSQQFSADCQIDFDTDMRIPELYIENIAERMQIYRDLDAIDSEEELVKFGQALADRFGKLPDEVQHLFEMIRIRWIAMSIGVEKLVYRQQKLVVYFVSNHHSPFYESEQFFKLMTWVASQKGNQIKLTQKVDKMSLSFSVLKDIYAIKDQLMLLYGVANQASE